MVVFRSINRVNTPPKVSMPRDNGVTSSSNTSLTSPVSTPAWMAAPDATTSSGLTPRCGSAPKNSFTVSIIFGILVIPPTRITSSISDAFTPASFNAALQGTIVRSTSFSTSRSSLALVSLIFRCFGPLASAVIKGRLMSVCSDADSSIFAFSAASFKRCSASLSPRRSMPSDDLNSSAKNSMIWWSKSSPPRNVSPLVDFTSKTPSPTSSTDTSNVPPPRS